MEITLIRPDYLEPHFEEHYFHWKKHQIGNPFTNMTRWKFFSVIGKFNRTGYKFIFGNDRWVSPWQYNMWYSIMIFDQVQYINSDLNC
jgi:hypothetical protein